MVGTIENAEMENVSRKCKGEIYRSGEYGKDCAAEKCLGKDRTKWPLVV